MTPAERLRELEELASAVMDAKIAIVWKAEEEDVLWPIEQMEDYLEHRLRELLEQHPALRIERRAA